MTAILPGSVSQPIVLADAVRDRYEAIDASIRKDIEARKKNRVPLDEATDWPAIEQTFESMRTALKAHDPGAFRDGLARLVVGATSIPSPLPAFQPNDAHAGVSFRVRKLSKKDYAVLVGEVDEIAEAARRLPEGEARQRMLRDVDTLEAQGRFLLAALVEVHGIGATSGPVSEATIEHLTYAGLLPDVYAVAREAQHLGPFAHAVFGLSPPSTSQTSTAASAAPLSDKFAGATAALPASTSREHATSPTSALGGNSFVIPASALSSSSTGAPTEGSAAST